MSSIISSVDITAVHPRFYFTPDIGSELEDDFVVVDMASPPESLDISLLQQKIDLLQAEVYEYGVVRSAAPGTILIADRPVIRAMADCVKK